MFSFLIFHGEETKGNSETGCEVHVISFILNYYVDIMSNAYTNPTKESGKVVKG